MTTTSKLRSRWSHMLSRCEDYDHVQYKDYGARGIKVCKEWHDYKTFHDWSMANGYSSELQLDRIDNEKDYSPDNCQYVTRMINNRNRRNTVRVTALGETKTIMEWSQDPRCPLEYKILKSRIERGWPVEDAILLPPRRGRRLSRT